MPFSWHTSKAVKWKHICNDKWEVGNLRAPRQVHQYRKERREEWTGAKAGNMEKEKKRKVVELKPKPQLIYSEHLCWFVVGFFFGSSLFWVNQLTAEIIDFQLTHLAVTRVHYCSDISKSLINAFAGVWRNETSLHAWEGFSCKQRQERALSSHTYITGSLSINAAHWEVNKMCNSTVICCTSYYTSN